MEHPRLPRRGPCRALRSAFTLVELLIVIGILLLIAAMTLSVVNIAINGDRTRGAARQVQSYLEGARSRAIYGGKNRGEGYQCGVRFIPELPSWQPATQYPVVGTKILPDARGTGFVYELTTTSGANLSGNKEPTWPTVVGATVVDNDLEWTCSADHILVTSLEFVETDPNAASITGGTITLAREDTILPIGTADGPEVVRVLGYPHPLLPANAGQPTRWFERARLGLIYHGQSILLNGRRYQISLERLATVEELVLMTPYVGPVNPTPTEVIAVSGARTPSYQLLLPSQPMPNQEPRVLGNRVVLDLSLSKGVGLLLANSQRMDIMFSPRGTVVGPLSGTGIVEFAVTDREDSLNGIPLAWTVWQPTTTYPAGATVIATTGDTTRLYRSSGGGSGGTEPTWITTPGSTTTDNTITWTCLAGPKRERMLVSLTPQTGKAAVHPIYLDPVGVTLDPYRYAETGEVAQQ